jgi:hypothetical protein
MSFVLKCFESQLHIFNCVDNMVPNLNEPGALQSCLPPWYLGTRCTGYHVRKNEAPTLLNEEETCCLIF